MSRYSGVPTRPDTPPNVRAPLPAAHSAATNTGVHSGACASSAGDGAAGTYSDVPLGVDAAGTAKLDALPDSTSHKATSTQGADDVTFIMVHPTPAVDAAAAAATATLNAAVCGFDKAITTCVTGSVVYASVMLIFVGHGALQLYPYTLHLLTTITLVELVRFNIRGADFPSHKRTACARALILLLPFVQLGTDALNLYSLRFNSIGTYTLYHALMHLAATNVRPTPVTMTCVTAGTALVLGVCVGAATELGGTLTGALLGVSAACCAYVCGRMDQYLATALSTSRAGMQRTIAIPKLVYAIILEAACGEGLHVLPFSEMAACSVYFFLIALLFNFVVWSRRLVASATAVAPRFALFLLPSASVFAVCTFTAWGTPQMSTVWRVAGYVGTLVGIAGYRVALHAPRSALPRYVRGLTNCCLLLTCAGLTVFLTYIFDAYAQLRQHDADVPVVCSNATNATLCVR